MITADLIQRENRKTLTLSVMKDGRVVVKAPHKMSSDLINKFIEDKQRWLEAKVLLVKNMREEFSECIVYKQTLIYGVRYKICVGDTKSVIVDSSKKTIVAPKSISDGQILTKLKNWYKGNAKKIVLSRLDYISKRIKIAYNGFRLTNAKGKWGSCNSKKLISINWRIVMLPPELIDYVIVHELCHIKEMNHSPKFWQTLSLFLPNYSSLRKQLKKYSFTLDLYR